MNRIGLTRYQSPRWTLCNWFTVRFEWQAQERAMRGGCRWWIVFKNQDASRLWNASGDLDCLRVFWICGQRTLSRRLCVRPAAPEARPDGHAAPGDTRAGAGVLDLRRGHGHQPTLTPTGGLARPELHRRRPTGMLVFRAGWYPACPEQGRPSVEVADASQRSTGSSVTGHPTASGRADRATR